MLLNKNFKENNTFRIDIKILQVPGKSLWIRYRNLFIKSLDTGQENGARTGDIHMYFTGHLQCLSSQFIVFLKTVNITKIGKNIVLIVPV